MGQNSRLFLRLDHLFLTKMVYLQAWIFEEKLDDTFVYLGPSVLVCASAGTPPTLGGKFVAF